MRALVWLSEWEWACCGDAFGVGERVAWTTLPNDDPTGLADVLGRELASQVHSTETHHELDSGRERPIAGDVRTIRAAFAASASTPEDPVTFRAVPGTVEFRELDRLDRDVIEQLSAASTITLLDGAAVPPIGPADLAPISERLQGVGWFAVAPRHQWLARRAWGVRGYLVDLDEAEFG